MTPDPIMLGQKEDIGRNLRPEARAWIVINEYKTGLPKGVRAQRGEYRADVAWDDDPNKYNAYICIGEGQFGDPIYKFAPPSITDMLDGMIWCENELLMLIQRDEEIEQIEREDEQG